MAALTTTVSGAQAKAADVQQFMDLLTGVMTGQVVTIANVTKGTALQATGLTGATSTGRWVGVTTTGAPVSGTFLLGDWITTQDGRMWVCTSPGTPGTWQQPSPPPDTTASDIVALAAAAAAGSVGKSADAGHVHPWTGLGVLGTAQTWTALQSFGTFLGGTLQTAAQPNITSLGAILTLVLAGVTGASSSFRIAGAMAAQPQGTASFPPASGTWNAGDVVGDLKGLLWVCRTAGTPGSWTVAVQGWGGQVQRIMTASTRSDPDAVEGDLLINA